MRLYDARCTCNFTLNGRCCYDRINICKCYFCILLHIVLKDQKLKNQEIGWNKGKGLFHSVQGPQFPHLQCQTSPLIRLINNCRNAEKREFITSQVFSEETIRIKFELNVSGANQTQKTTKDLRPFPKITKQTSLISSISFCLKLC